MKADAPQQHQSPSGDSAASFVPDKNTANEGNSKLSHTSDTQVYLLLVFCPFGKQRNF